MKSIYIGFMRLITLNFRLWCKPTNLGWKRCKKVERYTLTRLEKEYFKGWITGVSGLILGMMIWLLIKMFIWGD